MKQRLSTTLLSLLLLLSLLPGAAAAETGQPEILPEVIAYVDPAQVYTDVHATDWFYDGVNYVFSRGLMNGVSGTAFGPGHALTRAMVVTTLHRMEGQPWADSAGFSDVIAGSWFASGVNWAADKGIVYGVGQNTFAPNSPVTREQLAVILQRYAASKGYATGAMSELGQLFVDVGRISPYARSAMEWAYSTGLITGMSGTTLAPRNIITRAQLATILMRMDQGLGRAQITASAVTPGACTVFFDENYDGAPEETQYLWVGDNIFPPADPVRKGFAFAGWYTDYQGGELYNNFTLPVTRNLNLYAHWIDLTPVKVPAPATTTTTNKATPATQATSNESTTQTNTVSYVGNRRTHIFHKSNCGSVTQMNDRNKEYLGSRDQFISSGYTPCQNCKP